MNDKKEIKDEKLNSVNGGTNIVGSTPYINTPYLVSASIEGDDSTDKNNVNEETGK